MLPGGGGTQSQAYATWTRIVDETMEFKHLVVWDKGPMGLGGITVGVTSW